MLIDDSSFVLQGLETSPIFSELNQEDRVLFAKMGSVVRYEQGATVFSVDHHGDAFYLVVSGVLGIRLKNHKVKECHAGQIFGEIAIFDNRTRLGTIQIQEAAILAKFDKSCILEASSLPPVLRAKILMALTKQIISYLYNELPTSSRELISKGESDTIEFKNSASKDHFPKIVRTLAAMMNSQGGTILLGVEDSGGLSGLRLNSIQRVVLVRNLNLAISQRLDEYPRTLVHIDAEVIDSREIIRIDCEPSTVPVFLTENEKEALFVRISRENMQIRTLRDCIQYIKKRFSDVNPFSSPQQINKLQDS